VVRVPAPPLGQWNSPGRPYWPLITGPASARPILLQAPEGTGLPAAQGTVALPRKEQEKHQPILLRAKCTIPIQKAWPWGRGGNLRNPALHRLGCSVAGSGEESGHRAVRSDAVAADQSA